MPSAVALPVLKSAQVAVLLQYGTELTTVPAGHSAYSQELADGAKRGPEHCLGLEGLGGAEGAREGGGRRLVRSISADAGAC